MGNRLTNCGFLDGATGWGNTAQLTLSVDETVRGSAGRAALVGTGQTTAANQTQTLNSAVRGVVTAGEVVEISCAVAAVVNGVVTPAAASVAWFTAGGAQVSVAPLTVRPAQIERHGVGLKGVRNTYPTVRQRLAAPPTAATAEIRLSVTPAAAGSTVVLALVKPQIAPVPAGRTEPLSWEPGLHGAPDLQLPAWPLEMRSFDLGPDGEPLASGIEFQGESPGRPSQRRTGLSPARQFAGAVRCDPYERALLDDFWRATPGDFWFVEPGSDRLCVARFATDGQPRMTEDRGEVSTLTLNLWLETA